MIPPPAFPPGCSRRHPKRKKRVVEFFTAQINNDHTRKAYLNATRRFSEWAFLKQLQGQASAHRKTTPGGAAHAV